MALQSVPPLEGVLYMEGKQWYLETRSSPKTIDPSDAQRDKIGKALLELAAKCKVWCSSSCFVDNQLCMTTGAEPFRSRPPAPSRPRSSTVHR